MPSSRSRTRDENTRADQSSPSRQKRRRERPPVRVACAECRRLKLRCSEQFPCHNCVKKGCGAICPDGTMTTGKGNRIVIANTETLHEKINQLANRVRQLEDALAMAHALTTREPHPLLHEDLLSIKNPLELDTAQLNKPVVKDDEPDDTLDALGSLSISKRGQSAFFGHTANSWYVFQNEDDSSESAEESQTDMDVSRTDIPSCLPSPMVAREVVDVYYADAGWMSTPIPRDEFLQTVYLRIYEPVTVSDSAIEAHDLAVLYMLLAIGVQTDPTKKFNSPEAVRYFQLGRAALSLKSPLEEHTMTALQALVLMSHYYFFADAEQPIWVLTGIVTRLCVSIGLHRDSGKFNLPSEETKRRRSIMWEVYTQDMWQSFLYGRPPAFSLPYIDTQMPHETTLGPGGELEMNFHGWKHRFYGQVLSEIQQQSLSSQQPSYKAVLELEKKAREFYIPPSLLVPGINGTPIDASERPSTGLTAQRHMACFITEMCVFYMHRGFFAKAMEEQPHDLLSHKYSRSVVSLYNAACAFVGMMENLYSLEPQLSERLWFLFGHTFSCGLIFGSIAGKSRMSLALSALTNLDTVCRLFEQVKSPRASKVLPTLRRLSDNAHNYFQPQVVSEERACLAGTVRETGCTPADVPSPELGSLYPSPESGPPAHPPLCTPYSATGHNQGPAWPDYNNPEDFNSFWSSASAAQQEIMASNVGIGPGTPFIVAMQPIPEVPYYGEYGTEEQPIPETDLDVSWQNFMQFITN